MTNQKRKSARQQFVYVCGCPRHATYGHRLPSGRWCRVKKIVVLTGRLGK